MDSHLFVDDFVMGLQSDNRYLNQFSLGGGAMDPNSTGSDTGLDFNAGMMMMDTTSMLGGPAASSAAGMIDFPDELNSPTSAASNATTSATLSAALSTPSATAADPIPFPASLATESLNAIPMLNTMPNGNNRVQQPSNSMGMDMNMGMGMNGGMSMGMNPNMQLNMNPAAGFVPDTNQMFMQNYNNMQHNIMMNPQAQFYFQQQQQQQYMRMLQQQQRYQAMQQQNALMQQQQQMQPPQNQQQPPQAAAQALRQQVPQQPIQMPMQPTPVVMRNAQTAPQPAQARPNQAGMIPTATPVQRQLSGPTPGATTTTPATATTNGGPTPAAQANGAPGGAPGGTPAGASRATWHSPADQALRKEMLNQIMRVLRNQGSNAPPNWLQKLPEMAHRLEDECYRIAATREEYASTSTLQTRLKNIVRAAQNHQRVSRSTTPNPISSTTATPSATPAAASQVSTATPVPFPGAQPATSTPATVPTATVKVQDAAQAIQMPPELQDPPKQQSTKMEPNQQTPTNSTSSSIIDALMSDKVSMPESSISPLAQAPPSDTSNASNSAAAIAAANRSRSAQIIRQFKAKAQQVTSALDETQTTEYHNKLKSMTSSDIKTAGSKEVLQRQQQRLLLLRHAMWCKANEGSCTATLSCGEMKRLWQHMGACQHTNSCSYSHCISSKYVLSHFQQCANPKCLVCQVVRFPVEVKEKNGFLMMDADRALQQIYAVTQRRQNQAVTPTRPNPAALNQPQATPQQPPQATGSTQPMPIPMPPQLQQNGTSQPYQQNQPQQPLSMPAAVGGGAGMTASTIPAQHMNQSNGYAANGVVSGAPAMVRPSPQVQVPTAGNMVQGGQMQPGALMGQNGNMQNQTTGAAAAANANDAFVASLTEEDRRQLTIIQQKLLGWTLEQLNGHCKKLESLAEQIRTQMNSIMNECRQLLQRANTTQDLTVKGQFEKQVNEKRVTLKNLDVKYKRCNSQRRIVKHIISTRSPAVPGVGVSSVAAPPMSMTMKQPNANAMQPITMPPQMQPQQPQQIPFSPYQQPQRGPIAPSPMLGPQQTPQIMPQSVMKQSPDDILGEEIEMPAGIDLGAAGMPLEMPSDLQEPASSSAQQSASVTPAAGAQQTMKKELQPAQAAPATRQPTPSGESQAKKPSEETTVNPLTMNNSKLNAMMKEHRRMDSVGAVKAEPRLPGNVAGSVASTVENAGASAGAIVPVAVAVAGAAQTAPTPPADAPTSMLNELSNEDLEAHIDSLVTYYNATMSPTQLKKRLEGLLKGMMEHKFGWVFSSPVDPVALGIPNYFKIIRRPMDLGTIKKKLDLGIYKNLHQFAVDVRLTFNNAKTYNSEEQDVYNLAKDMLADFNAELRKLEVEVNEEERAVREKESSCRLCGVERMVFEPAVLYCNGECNSRIRRNCYYYTSSDNKYHCCHPCYGNLMDTVKHNEGRVYKKTELSRKKNDEVHEEPWVQCDTCNRWVHQICALFNGKIDAEKKPQQVKSENSKGNPASSSNTSSSTPSTSKENGGTLVSAHSISSTPGSEFLCPECLLDHRKKEPQKYKIGRHAFNAKDLMRTKLSDYLERRIYKALQDEREDEAKWTNQDVKDIQTAEGLTVRQVSNIEKQLMVRDKMFQRYKDSHKYTYEHRFKSKCVCMFQEIHGVSVLLFGMYVHEFDEQEADCNARRVYISYLDSVNYFEPPHLRTKVYHELLIAYMDFVKQLGFHTAHLWACPPLKGDDYILYCHPESQKTPKSDRLRQWYVDMLVKAQAENVVWQITNMYDDFWRDDNSACALPYFEGDYWVGLAEDLIEKIESEKPKKAKKASTTKRKTAETKKGSKKSKAKKTKRRKTGPGVGENDGENMSDGEGDGDDNDTGDEDNESAAGGEKAKKETPITSLDTVDRTITDPLMKKLGEVIEPMKDDFLVVKLHPCCRVCNTTVLQGVTWQDLNTKTEVCLNPKTVQTVLCDACYQKAKLTPKLQARLNVLTRTEMNIPLKITDPDEVKDSEFFDTRQAFLSLCQGNHYQFDELRRAKHSSMMALYHLGNPNPNAYIYECNACTQDIVTGNRWHCHTCPDFDVCDACYEKEKHEHPLEMIPTSGAAGGSGGANGGGANGAALTEEQRRLREHRAKNVRLHMQLLVHSSSCADGNCGSSNCEKMKELMRHGAQCKLRAYGGCTICRRVWALLQLHARQCRQYECKVPRCHDLREHVRKLQLQQQLMDDRRRAAVTQQYRQMQSGGDEKGGQEQGNGSAEDEPMGA
ncbi:Histone acetyltransferase [Globisporangium polare]